MTECRAPFRADMVGSLLRPRPIKEAREKRERGEISAEELTAVEDEEIRKLVAKEEYIGLIGITGNPGGTPVKCGLPVGDLGAGMFCALSEEPAAC